MSDNQMSAQSDDSQSKLQTSPQSQQKIPPVAALVQAGQKQTEAEAINDFIFMVHDVSNAYLVNTDDGDVMINAGFITSTEKNTTLFKPKRSGPLRAIFLTQAHPDHYGGVPAFVEEDTQIIAEQRFSDTCEYFRMLDPYIRGRSGKIWAGTLKQRDMEVPTVTPTVVVDNRQIFEFGGRRFEVISTPGGESPDAIVVWMPDERVIFTGNLFGPILDSVPNLCTTRGDKPRSARRYLDCMDIVLGLGAETLVTGHGAPVYGAENVRKMLEKMRAAVQYIHDKTVEGMNAGKDVHTLMREIRLPEDIKIGEYHGKVNWAVRTIWEEYSGWFHMDSTTSLYGTPRSSINTDLANLAGGVDQLAERAQQKIDANCPLEALHLTDISLAVEPGHRASLLVNKTALGMLLEASDYLNMSETMWLRGQIAGTDALLEN